MRPAEAVSVEEASRQLLDALRDLGRPASPREIWARCSRFLDEAAVRRQLFALSERGQVAVVSLVAPGRFALPASIHPHQALPAPAAPRDVVDADDEPPVQIRRAAAVVALPPPPRLVPEFPQFPDPQPTKEASMPRRKAATAEPGSTPPAPPSEAAAGDSGPTKRKYTRRTKKAAASARAAAPAPGERRPVLTVFDDGSVSVNAPGLITREELAAIATFAKARGDGHGG